MPDIFCYILKLSNGKYYTGITKDLVKRLKQHNNGESISTRHGRPCKVVYYTKWPDYSSARKVEVYVKRKGARKFLTDPVALEGLVST